MLFCDQCGGGNADSASTCKFCHQPLSRSQLHDADAEDPLPLRSTRRQIMQQVLLPPPPAVTLKPGVLFHERYRIVAILGEGGYGSTFKAKDIQRHDQAVAVKMIDLAGHSASEVIDATATFYGEAAILSSLHHPGIPHLHEQFTEGQRWFLVMDYVEGRTLEDYFLYLYPAHYRMPMVIRALLEVALKLCEILIYLHSQNPPIIYRDLKPSNIIIGAHKKVSLIDFGIARHYRKGQAKDTIPFGSPGYAAPEQYGRAQTTIRSDIYSLGALLHQMLTGQDPATHPFRFPPIPENTHVIPPTVRELVTHMLEMDPEKRPLDVQKVRDVLSLALQTYASESAEIYIPSAKSTQTASSRPISRRAAVAFGVVWGVGIIGLGIGLGVANRNSGSQRSVPPIPTLSNELQPGGLYGSGSPIAVIANGHNFLGTVVATQDHHVQVVSETGKTSGVYKGHAGTVQSIATYLNTYLVVSCQKDENILHVWRADDGKLVGRVQVPAPVTALMMTTDLIVFACSNLSVYTYDCSRLSTNIHKSASGLKSYCRMPARVRDLYWFEPASKTPLLVCGDDEGYMRVWQNKQSSIRFKHEGPVNELSGQGQYVASAGDDGIVIVGNIQSGDIAARYTGHTKKGDGRKVRHVIWLNNSALASLDDQGEVHIWTIDPSGPITEYDTPVLTTRAVPDYRLNAWEANSGVYLALVGDERSIVNYRVQLRVV